MDLGYTIRIERAAAKMFAQRLHLAKTIRNPADRYHSNIGIILFAGFLH